MGATIIEPTLNEIIDKLKLVLSEELSREEMYDWTAPFIMADDPIVEDEDVWDALITVSGIDYLDSPETYLYSDEDIKSWIKQFEKIK